MGRQDGAEAKGDGQEQHGKPMVERSAGAAIVGA
jgi:hypothetical protein